MESVDLLHVVPVGYGSQTGCQLIFKSDFSCFFFVLVHLISASNVYSIIYLDFLIHK